MKYLVLLLLLAAATTSKAEPFYPALAQHRIETLRQKLRRGPADTSRVNVLVALSRDLVSRAYYSDNPADTAVAYARQAQALSRQLGYVAGQIESDYALAFCFLRDTNGPKAREAAAQGLARSEQQSDTARAAVGWYMLGETYNTPADSARRLQYYTKAASLARAVRQPQVEGRSLKEMADIHFQQGRLRLARQELQRVLSLYRRNGYPLLHYTYDLLGITSDVLGDYPEALRFTLAAVRSATATHDTVSLATFYARVADVYAHLNQRRKAIDYYRLALRNSESIHSTFGITESTSAIVHNLILVNEPGQALALLMRQRQAHPPQDDYSRLMLADGLTQSYLGLKQYAQARTSAAQLLRLLQTDLLRDNYHIQARVYRTLGKYYLATRDYTKAEAVLKKAVVAVEQVGNMPNLANTNLLLYRADSAQGHLLPAIAHYKRYKELTDSIFTERNSKQMALTQVQFETEKREQRIALLTKQTQVQQANIARQQTQRNAVLASSGLLLLLLGLGYNRYRLKQRSNLLLEGQQREIDHKNQALEQVLAEKEGLLVEKEWMLKEIHHRVKNNLQIVNELLASQTDYLRDEHTLAIIRESQNRIQAMALIHQKLYQAQNIARVNMQEYIREIVEHLVASFDCEELVQTCLDVAAIELDVTVATPLGLIINEAVTNSLKYAFPDGQEGSIAISLTQTATNDYELRLADDGVGLPPGLKVNSSRTLGLTMIRGLSEQLNGTLSFEPGPGVRICLRFEVEPKAAPPGWAA
ncbi:histidine kinase dimerization/phosphoacceptor domain -containing protein [Hymenobacter fodinae]|uniref:histidine kinase n=1 Tax=Hymenobacter fodinae TaxID=2510796 RepID=A0A4Z0NZ51_9BACT|nr:histidine kinase dimerization/phosphoacceptor domain -containing protein [Hymenobacter fodinae]TGE03822.1 histidine kinase [Hymenobacter fodinae]